MTVVKVGAKVDPDDKVDSPLEIPDEGAVVALEDEELEGAVEEEVYCVDEFPRRRGLMMKVNKVDSGIVSKAKKKLKKHDYERKKKKKKKKRRKKKQKQEKKKTKKVMKRKEKKKENKKKKKKEKENG